MTESWVFADMSAEHLGVSNDSICTWISKKDMRAHRLDRLWKFKFDLNDNWFHTSTSASADETAKLLKQGAR